MRKADSILDLIGATPVIRLGRIIPEGAAIVWA
ncbi:MAG: cysteine synthase A, partial [Candidatus Latescibacteria bacterium]|nr:cysteine synthase A [Candidatus Latescibacterota bacterium]